MLRHRCINVREWWLGDGEQGRRCHSRDGCEWVPVTCCVKRFELNREVLYECRALSFTIRGQITVKTRWVWPIFDCSKSLTQRQRYLNASCSTTPFHVLLQIKSMSKSMSNTALHDLIRLKTCARPPLYLHNPHTQSARTALDSMKTGILSSFICWILFEC